MAQSLPLFTGQKFYLEGWDQGFPSAVTSTTTSGFVISETWNTNFDRRCEGSQ